MKRGGFASSFKSPNSSMVNDKGALLPASTKASSEDADNSNELKDSAGLQSQGTIALSGRHLPPVYVDIQEEIETNIDEINR